MNAGIRWVAIFVVLISATVSARAGVDRFTNVSPAGAEISALAVDPLEPSRPRGWVMSPPDASGLWRNCLILIVFVGAVWGCDPTVPAPLSPLGGR